MNVQGELVYRSWPSIRCEPDLAAGRDLREDPFDRPWSRCFEGRPPLRSEAASMRALPSCGVARAAPQEISRTVQALLERLGRIQATLPKAAPAGCDIRRSLMARASRILPVTPGERLKEYPRYLQAPSSGSRS